MRHLEVIFTPEKNAEIIRYLQLNNKNDTSPIMICALEYHILTGEYLPIGTVCTLAAEYNEPIRKNIYIPDSSIVKEWAEEQKKTKRGLLSVKVRQILRNSISLTDDSESEECIAYEDCVSRVLNVSQKKNPVLQVPDIPSKIAENNDKEDTPPPKRIENNMGGSKKVPVKEGIMDKLKPADWD